MSRRERRAITHPDDLVEGRKYSVTLLPMEEGKKIRVSGRFDKLVVERSDRTAKSELYVLVKVTSGEVYGVNWRYSENWREI